MRVDRVLTLDPAGARGDEGGVPGATDLARSAGELERLGFDGAWTTETGHDPFLPLAAVAGATSSLTLGTSIAVAFARNPMTLAMIARDLQTLSGGRFALGLGSQIKPHITKRYSMPWSQPAARMRELVLAVRAIWSSWDTDDRLAFRGDFYTHTLMTPVFSPGPSPFGDPPILLAAVGPVMTEVAGEVADGLIVHPFTTLRYMNEVTLPALARGAARVGKALADLTVSYPGFVITGRDEAEAVQATQRARERIAFYASTPAYRPVLELHGWGELQPVLHSLSRQGEWEQMSRLIDDDVLEAFAVVGPPEEVPKLVTDRLGGLVDRFTLSGPLPVTDDAAALWLDRFRTG